MRLAPGCHRAFWAPATWRRQEIYRCKGDGHTHLGKQTLVWEKKRKNETEGKTQCVWNYFLCFQFCLSCLCLWGVWLGWQLKKKQSTWTFLLFIPFFFFSGIRDSGQAARPSWLRSTQWKRCGKEQMLTFGVIAGSSLSLRPHKLSVSKSGVSTFSVFQNLTTFPSPPPWAEQQSSGLPASLSSTMSSLSPGLVLSQGH